MYVFLNLLFMFYLHILILHHLDYLCYLKFRDNSPSSGNSKVTSKVSYLNCCGINSFRNLFESLDSFIKFLNKSVCHKPLKVLKILD